VPEAAPRLAWQLSAGYFLWYLGVSLVLWLVAPRFLEVFEQVKVPVPLTTLALARLSELARSWPVPWIFAGMTCSMAVAFCPPGAPRKVARYLLTALIVGSTVWMALAFAGPLLDLLDGLSGRRR
jgi:type II secretory pathway component PulF